MRCIILIHDGVFGLVRLVGVPRAAYRLGVERVAARIAVRVVDDVQRGTRARQLKGHRTAGTLILLLLVRWLWLCGNSPSDTDPGLVDQGRRRERASE